MATPSQIEANRANARRSTGPRTAAGKARSAANSTRHGFCSQSVLLPGDDPAEYQTLLDELREAFPCVDLPEHRFVREMADAEWRLRRVRQHQETLLTEACEEISSADPSLDPDRVQVRAYDQKSTTLAVLMRYETKFERQYDRAFKGWCSYQIQRRDSNIRAYLRQVDPILPIEPNPPDDPIPELTADRRSLTAFLPIEPNLPVQTPRNAPCPCGSGAKYKRCCGRNAAPVLSY
jgi:hypothetical protein